MGSGQEDIMKTLLDAVHRYEISRGKDGRWATYVPDQTKPRGRREVRRKSLTDLYKYLISFYDLDITLAEEETLTFEQLFSKWVEYKKQFVGASNSKKSISPSTVRRYERDYDHYIKGTDFAELRISLISSTLLEEFFLQIIREYQMSDTNAGNVIGYFSQAFAFARRSRLITENPMDYIDKQLLLSKCTLQPEKTDEERILSEKEMVALLSAVQEHEKKYPAYMPDYAIELAMLTGMRVGELAALKWSCVDDVYIHIDYSEHRLDYSDKPTEFVVGEPKNRKHRVIPVTKDIRELFSRIKEVHPTGKDDFIFVKKNGNRYRASEIGGAVRRRCASIGIENGSIHRIRRTVSSVLNQVLPQKDVSALLGHTETVNEMHYNYSTADIQEKTSALIHLSGFLKGKTGTKTA